MAKLGDICTNQSSNIKQSDLENNNGSYPIYGASGLIKNVDFYKQEKPYVAIVKDGAGVGRVMQLPAYSSVIGTMQYIIPNDDTDVKYLAYAMEHMNLAKYYSGATIPHIYFKDYKNEYIKGHNIETQKKIATTLDKVTHTIDTCNAILEKLDLLVKSRFVEMFGDIDLNPFNWEKAPMGNYMSLLTDFSANGSYEYLDSNVIMYDEPNYALMVRTTDLEKNDFVNDVKYIDEKAYNILSKSKIFGNEIIMNKIGSAGKVYLMPILNKPVSLGRNAFMFRFNEEINIIFLYHLLISEYGAKEIQQHVRGAVTKTITKEAARSVRIIIPPLALQQQFAAFVEQTDKTKQQVKMVLEKAETLKKALMQEYFG